jgi:hypothetical protein
VAGMPLPVAAPLTCACTPPSDAAPPVRFGVDTIAACAVPLTPAQLRSFCRSGATALPASLAGTSSATLTQRFLILPAGALVGVWGSASSLVLSDWVPLAQEVPGAPPAHSCCTRGAAC